MLIDKLRKLVDSLEGIFQANRYHRQVAYIGRPGQARLLKKVCIVGAGGLGTATADMLARSGVHDIRIIDSDKVEESNLQRQTLYDSYDIGQKKVLAARRRIMQINNLVRLDAIDNRLSKENLQLLDCDLVLDCCDDMKTRFLINRYCVTNGIPWIYCAVATDKGLVKLITRDSACLNCFQKPGAEPESGRVLNTTVQVASSIQTSLALRFFLYEEEDARLYSFNIWDYSFRKIEVRKQEGCIC